MEYQNQTPTQLDATDQTEGLDVDGQTRTPQKSQNARLDNISGRWRECTDNRDQNGKKRPQN